MEDSFPIIDILQQTPPIPDSCQWALFLHNHDECFAECFTRNPDLEIGQFLTRSSATKGLPGAENFAPVAGSLNYSRKGFETMTWRNFAKIYSRYQR